MQNKPEARIELRTESHPHRLHLCLTACVNAVLVSLAVAAVLGVVPG